MELWIFIAGLVLFFLWAAWRKRGHEGDVPVHDQQDINHPRT